MISKAYVVPTWLSLWLELLTKFWKWPDDPDFCLPAEILNLVDWFENFSSHFQDHEVYLFYCHSPLLSGQSSSFFCRIISQWAIRRDVNFAHQSPCCYIHYTEKCDLLDFSFKIILPYYLIKLNKVNYISQQKFLNSQNTNLSVLKTTNWSHKQMSKQFRGRAPS